MPSISLYGSVCASKATSATMIEKGKEKKGERIFDARIRESVTCIQWHMYNRELHVLIRNIRTK